MQQTLGRYQLLEEIGSGAMAKVFKAFDPDIQRTLAVKVLHSERCIDSDYRTRFLREAKAAGNLSHNNIVTIYDVGEAAGRPYIAMEFLDGIPLDRLIKSQRHFTLPEVVKIMVQLTRALIYAHDHGIVHRDIKPSNILYAATDPGDSALCITDFGIAHIEDANLTLQTEHGELLGTPHYMSPEQILGRPVDGRSDLFSLGVVLYELLTGRKPFKADTIAALMFRIVTDDPAPISSLKMDIPESLQQLADKLLRKSPDKRFRDGRQLLQELGRIQAALTRVTPGVRANIRDTRWPWVILAGAIAALLMLPLAASLLGQQQRAFNQILDDHGTALISLIAADSAALLLGQDWLAVELSVSDLSARHGIADLVITDHTGVVRGAFDKARLGKQYVVAVTAGSRQYQSPVLYQEQRVGMAYLQLAAKNHSALLRWSVAILAVIILCTCGTVMYAVYVRLGAHHATRRQLAQLAQLLPQEITPTESGTEYMTLMDTLAPGPVVSGKYSATLMNPLLNKSTPGQP